MVRLSNLNIEKKMISFAIGTGRCGTKFLSEVLKAEKEVSAHHEIHPNSDTFYRFMKWYDLPVDKAGFLARKQAVITEELKKKNFFFESSAYLSLSVHELHREFNSKFVLLIRNPKSVVKSYIKKGWYQEEVELEDPNKIPSFQNVTQAHHFLGRTLPRGEEYLRWSKLTRVGKISWYWTFLNGEVLKQFQNLPEASYRICQIEEFNYNVYQDLCEFIGFNSHLSKSKFEAIRKDKPNSFAYRKNEGVWNDLEEKEFNQEVADLAKKMGYSI